MSILAYRARWAAGFFAAATAAASLAACSDVKNSLVSLQQPGTITPSSATGPAGAEGLRVGAINRFQTMSGGGGGNTENLFMMSDLMTDEWKSGDTFIQRNEVDQRQTETSNANVETEYQIAQAIRGATRDAITSFAKYAPDSTSHIAQMWFLMGYAEMELAETMCNGIPLSITVNGTPQYAQPSTDSAVFQVALSHLDSAIALAGGADAYSQYVKNAATVVAARTLVDLGQFSAATALSANVPTSFQYVASFNATNFDNEVWTMATNIKRFVVGDSFDQSGTIGNAIPFASLHDPRVPVIGCSVPNTPGCTTPTNIKTEDNATPYVGELIYGQDDPMPVASGLDARLIDAEAKLHAGDINGMMTILNALRAAPPAQGIFQVKTPMPALATPASQAAAVQLFFREKALWQFARGMRLGDMRRMIRQYGLSANQVFPTGTFFKGGVYGNDVNLPVPDNERTNPLFHGCIDRNA